MAGRQRDDGQSVKKVSLIVLAFFGGVLVLMLVAVVFYDRRARRRGLRPGCQIAT